VEHNSKFQELISLYALGAADGGELWEFEEHIETGCVVCQKLLRDTESVLSLIAFSLEDIPLSPNVEKMLFSRI
jgi:hypothetical protein